MLVNCPESLVVLIPTPINEERGLFSTLTYIYTDITNIEGFSHPESEFSEKMRDAVIIAEIFLVHYIHLFSAEHRQTNLSMYLDSCNQIACISFLWASYATTFMLTGSGALTKQASRGAYTYFGPECVGQSENEVCRSS